MTEDQPEASIRRSLERAGGSAETTFGAITARWRLTRPSETALRAVSDALAREGVAVEPPLSTGLAEDDRLSLELVGSLRGEAAANGNGPRAPRARTASRASTAPPASQANRLILLIGGAVLLGSLFLPWFGTAEGDSVIGAPSTAWEWFGALDLVCVLVGVAALIAALEQTPTPRAIRVLALALSLGAGIAIALEIAAPPEQEALAGLAEVSAKPGAWFALVASMAIAYAHLSALFASDPDEDPQRAQPG